MAPVKKASGPRLVAPARPSQAGKPSKVAKRTPNGAKPVGFQAKKRATRLSNIKAKLAAGEPAPLRARVYLGKQNTDILTGISDVAEWSEEELVAGRRFAKTGTRVGRPPIVVPRVVHEELARRTLQGAQEHLRKNLEGVVQVLTAIASSDAVEPKDRLRAIAMVMDRVMGKVPDTINVRPDMPWVQAITDGIVPTGAVPGAIIARSRPTLPEDE